MQRADEIKDPALYRVSENLMNFTDISKLKNLTLEQKKEIALYLLYVINHRDLPEKEIDAFFEPLMQRCGNIRWLTALFGSGKGSGAAMMMGVLGLLGVLLCLAAGKRLRKYHYCDGDGAE